MPTDVEVCQANPASFFSFGPYAWQPFGVLVQNRSNIAFYANEGTYCDENNYRFVVPPYYQGAFLVSGNQISFKFDKNGVLGPIPALERATVFITDTFISPGLFPFAATVRDTINAAQAVVGGVTGTGSLTANFPTIQPGLYEVYGWSMAWMDVGEIDGDALDAVYTFQLQLSTPSTQYLDLGYVSNGGRDYGIQRYDYNSFLNPQSSVSTNVASQQLNGAATTIGQRYKIFNWGCSIQDALGSAGDGRNYQGQLFHTEQVGTLIDSGLGENGGIVNTNRIPVSIIDKWFPVAIDYTPQNAGNFAVFCGTTAAFTSNQNYRLWLRYAPASQGIRIGPKTTPIGYNKTFNPPLLVQVPSGATGNFRVQTLLQDFTAQFNQNLFCTALYAPLRF